MRLPIDATIPDIRAHLRRARALVIEAPPGSGKTTRVPPALLDEFSGEIWVLEPRRIAARMAARRVAQERAERVGYTIGYQVRFEEVAGPRTRLRFMTEGVFTRRMLSNPELRGVACVVLDEFHERHLEADVALALLDRLQRTSRSDLRIIVMSATLHAEPLVQYLGGCPAIRAEGRLFELRVEHTAYAAKPLEEQVADAVAALLSEALAGDVLVFLPGAAEIRRSARACGPIAERHQLLVLPLHGDMSPEDQDRAVSPADRPKVILSTNVAESSITIEGVRAVIDSGLARVARDSPWTGLPRVEVARISKASATQRAGRAARTGPGRVIRLYSAEDFARRTDHDAPEIARRELSHTLLELKAIGTEGLRWLEAPPAPTVAAAEELLRRLDADKLGRTMAELPLHPRLARLVIEAERRGAGDAGCAVAAFLSSGQRLEPQRTRARSDLLALLEMDWSPGTRRVYEQLHRSLGAQASRLRRGQNGDPNARLTRAKRITADSHGARWGPQYARALRSFNEDALLIAVLAAFPDRVARRRGADLLLASGGSAVLDASSAVHSDLLVAVDVEERPERGLPLVRLASGIEPEWLIDLFPECVKERTRIEWNRAAERVEQVSALVYDELIIEESRSGTVDPEAAARLLADKTLEEGLERFADADEVAAFLNRVAFAAEHSQVSPLGQNDVRAALQSLVAGLRSFAELSAAARDGGLVRALAARLPGGAQALEKFAPERIRLPSGRFVRVNYERDRPPWIASRLQDFFGMRETPRVAGGKVPLVVHLLAPNQRAVQITSDLMGFWERQYPQVRRELSRRYPRHKWPERPV